MQREDYEYQHNRMVATAFVSTVAIVFATIFLVAVTVVVQTTMRVQSCVEADKQWVEGACVDETTP